MIKKVCFALCLLFLVSRSTRSQSFGGGDRQRSVTLYSPNRYAHDKSRACFNFRLGEVVSRCLGGDLAYGTLYAGDELDWFDTTVGGRGERTLIKDLGPREWNEQFLVPAVEPLPKLKPGERRSVTIDTSGAPGQPGAKGAKGSSEGIDGPDWQRDAVEMRDIVRKPAPPPQSPPPPPREPRASPVFVKARAGHMYVIHVVNDESDYYALFRVDSLERGDNCTITWKIIDAPRASNN